MNQNQSSTETSTVTEPKPARTPRRKDTKNLWERDGIWYFTKIVKGVRMFNGRATPFSLETGDYNVAKAKRDAILRAGNGSEIDRIMGKESRKPATLGEIWEAYRVAPTVRASEKTRGFNFSGLYRMVRVVKGELTDEQLAAVSSAELTKQFVKDWQTAKLEAARIACNGDLAAMEAAKRSMNSSLTHVQSIFSREARDDYGSLYLPAGVAEFASAFGVKARKQEEPTQLSDAFMEDLLGRLPALQKADPASWAVFHLMMWGGLRNVECFHAQTSWLELVPAGYQINMKPTKAFLPKGNSRHTILPAHIGEGLLSQVKKGTTDLVPAQSSSARWKACYRRLNKWLKAQGVGADSQKIAYRLRKWFLNKVKEQQGIRFAQSAGGHSNLSTLQDHYTGAPRMAEPLKFKTG